LAHALRQNEHVRKIDFHLGGVSVNANFEPLLREVEQRKNLEEVMLMDTDDDGERLPSIHSRPFLEAFQQNDKITNVKLSELLLSGN